MLRTLRPVLACLGLAVAAVLIRLAGWQVAPPLAALIFGAAVVGASFVLAWAAEAAEEDISGGLAIAVLALIAVLPEYAVDLYFAYRAGSDPRYVQFAAANMTGSNRLLLGLGWSVVTLLALGLASRRSGRSVRQIVLGSEYRTEIGFLGIAALVAFVIPATGMIHLVVGIVLLAFFGYYLFRVATGEESEGGELVGPPRRIAELPAVRRRTVVVAMFVIAAAVILISAEPFADALVETGRMTGVDEFLLVQWLAPLSSEAPEFIVAIIFATRGKAAVALGMLISAKINQWTLLVGSLPIAYLIGGGHAALPLDGRQLEEVLLTACQTLLGVAVLMGLRFPRWAAILLLVAFGAQFAVPGTVGRVIISAIYLVSAVVAVGINRRHILPTLLAPLRRRRLEAGRHESADEPIGQRAGGGVGATTSGR